ncbi:transcriptional regulator, TetR family [Rhodococcus aetherivorans]|uniref:Transcriptional regulator, TetR family n=1 Tax=Rhodococcus aetherivorans TaxID=191292 RepID=A0ABQ0YME7_9NOCA|nr:TetR-like C-terminal domain-containing protein [Rhodococcus aetherivorans]ETT26008.1 WHG domain containing protein [Rhodococcus rhodochrous ATCC 21198]MDV6294566.1 WHG domain-containing protein [Rhodococcus aetherivorans]NGP26156.1 TetR/AcrR family transcriptional regulator [Rhodococcus aetherivorans]GES37678.1 transcriptional regulator, TetR family [Rhodococcus aetherivorans]
METEKKLPMRRRNLSREKVIEAALEAVDESGWEQLTMSTLAGRLGIVTASLYNHVRGLDDVRGEIQVRTMADLGERLREVAMGRSGPEGLRTLIDAHRAWAAEHPHRYQTLTTEPIERSALIAAALDANRALRSMLASCGVPEEDTLEAAVSLFTAMHGFATIVRSGFLGDELDLDRIYENVVAGAFAAAGVTPLPR